MSTGDGLPAGWYNDGTGTVRWWDGWQWTEQVLDAAAAASFSPVQPQTMSQWPTAGAPSGTPPWASSPYQGPAGQTALGYGGTVPAAVGTKRTRWGLWTALGLLAVLVVAGGAFAIVQSMNTKLTPEDVVMRYDSAFQDESCSLYMSSTTDDFKESMGVSDCDAFDEVMDQFAYARPYLTQITSSKETSSVRAEVRTEESWHDPSTGRASATYRYSLVRDDEDDVWRIDAVEDLGEK